MSTTTTNATMTTLVTIQQKDGWADDCSVKQYQSIDDVVSDLHELCQVFEGFPYLRVIENDMPYDIDSLYDWYRAAMKSVTGNEPTSYTAFYDVISKHTTLDQNEYDDAGDGGDDSMNLSNNDDNFY
jgi:hypothetical protein